MNVRMGMVESRFADIVWENAPLTTLELVKICAAELNWKRPTTYTVLRKMCERGIFRMENSMVTVLIPKNEFQAIQSENFVKETFQGSLPAFIAAFATRQTLSPEELKEIQNVIDNYGA